MSATNGNDGLEGQPSGTYDLSTTAHALITAWSKFWLTAQNADNKATEPRQIRVSIGSVASPSSTASESSTSDNEAPGNESPVDEFNGAYKVPQRDRLAFFEECIQDGMMEDTEEQRKFYCGALGAPKASTAHNQKRHHPYDTRSEWANYFPPYLSKPKPASTKKPEPKPSSGFAMITYEEYQILYAAKIEEEKLEMRMNHNIFDWFKSLENRHGQPN